MANTIDNRSGNQNQPIRLRPVTETAIGTTAFFRNRPLVDTLLNALAQKDKKEVKILFHGCSIGAETYSFIVQYLRNSCDHLFNIICHATDKEHSFIEFAKYAVYPKEILEGMSEDERLFFHHLDTHNVTVSEKVTRYAAFLDTCKAETFTTTGIYDVVFLLNLLVYVPASYQSTIIDKIAHNQIIEGDILPIY